MRTYCTLWLLACCHACLPTFRRGSRVLASASPSNTPLKSWFIQRAKKGSAVQSHSHKGGTRAALGPPHRGLQGQNEISLILSESDGRRRRRRRGGGIITSFPLSIDTFIAFTLPNTPRAGTALVKALAKGLFHCKGPSPAHGVSQSQNCSNILILWRSFAFHPNSEKKCQKSASLPCPSPTRSHSLSGKRAHHLRAAERRRPHSTPSKGGYNKRALIRMAGQIGLELEGDGGVAFGGCFHSK